MDDIYQLEWTFSPKTYFEQGFDLEILGACIEIREGTITARVPPAIYESNDQITAELQEHLLKMLSGNQLVAKCAFELSEPNTTRIYTDGRRVFYLKAQNSICITQSSVDDLIVVKADGTRLDSRVERTERKRNLAMLAASHDDQHLTAMFQSLQQAMCDNANSLVHLYEIRDCLADRFGGEHKAKKALPGSKSAWSKLGDLANKQPLAEGRHRGRMTAKLRPATPEEFSLAIKCATDLILAYLSFLESANQE